LKKNQSYVFADISLSAYVFACGHSLKLSYRLKGFIVMI